ncbi:MAG: HAD family hydrolase [Spartobacteria bacterium]|nr:HAD family hydrolase [Spartobacteria bacterium]
MMETNNKWLIFDFDGTLADTFRTAYKIFNELAGPFNYRQVREDEVETMRRKTARDFFSSLGISMIKIPFLAIQARRELHKHMAEVAPIRGMPEVLPKLKEQGWRMGILTSNATENVRTFLETHNLQSFFEFSYCAHDMFGKAHKLKALMRKYNLDPAGIVYVGDSDADIEAAHQANIKIAGVTWGYQAREVIEKHHPTWLLDTPEQLTTL